MEGCNMLLTYGHIQEIQSKQRYIMIYWQESGQAISDLVQF